MDSLNELEIQNIRHICGMACSICDKSNYYKTLTSDDKVLNLFDKTCTELTSLKTSISNML